MRNQEVTFKRRVLRKLKNIILNFASYFIPKKKNYLVFYPLLDKESFSGNIRSLILYVNENYPQFQTGLITLSPKATAKAELESVSTIHSKTRRVFWHLLRAQYILIDAHTEMFMHGRFSFIQLWHGSGFKNVGCMWENSQTPAEKRKSLYKKVYRQCKFVLATSEHDAHKQNLSFQTNLKEVMQILNLPVVITDYS